MKKRKKANALAIERRNAVYNKTIIHNRELAEKNMELSYIIDDLKDKCRKYEKYINRKRWWEFWKHIYQYTCILNETEAELYDVDIKIATTTYFYNIPIWRHIEN